jgi:hypothetical protein
MTSPPRAAEISGRTIRFIWEDGPTKGLTHEHVFHDDGTVEWRDAAEPRKAGGAKERPGYGAFKVAEGIFVVSYLAPSGYTLTVVLNFGDRRIVGFASGASDWYPVQGRFEVVSPPPARGTE